MSRDVYERRRVSATLAGAHVKVLSLWDRVGQRGKLCATLADSTQRGASLRVLPVRQAGEQRTTAVASLAIAPG